MKTDLSNSLGNGFGEDGDSDGYEIFLLQKGTPFLVLERTTGISSLTAFQRMME